MAQKGPYKLCTVNTAPERAKLVVGRFIENVKEIYTINHVENVESMSSQLYPFITAEKPRKARVGRWRLEEFEAKFDRMDRD
jgi:hypothetical protein